MIDDRIELCCCSSVLLAIRSVAEREREREGLDSGSERGIVVYNGMFPLFVMCDCNWLAYCLCLSLDITFVYKPKGLRIVEIDLAEFMI